MNPAAHPPHVKAAVLELVQAGETTLRAGAAHGVSQGTVSYWARAAGVGRRGPPKLDAQRREAIRQALQRGKTITETAAELRASRRTVRAVRDLERTHSHG